MVMNLPMKFRINPFKTTQVIARKPLFGRRRLRHHRRRQSNTYMSPFSNGDTKTVWKGVPYSLVRSFESFKASRFNNVKFLLFWWFLFCFYIYIYRLIFSCYRQPSVHIFDMEHNGWHNLIILFSINYVWFFVILEILERSMTVYRSIRLWYITIQDILALMTDPLYNDSKYTCVNDRSFV